MSWHASLNESGTIESGMRMRIILYTLSHIYVYSHRTILRVHFVLFFTNVSHAFLLWWQVNQRTQFRISSFTLPHVYHDDICMTLEWRIFQHFKYIPNSMGNSSLEMLHYVAFSRCIIIRANIPDVSCFKFYGLVMSRESRQCQSVMWIKRQIVIHVTGDSSLCMNKKITL